LFLALPRGRVRKAEVRVIPIEKVGSGWRQKAAHSSNFSGSTKSSCKAFFVFSPPSGEGPQSGGEGHPY
jgi:hypothetical protein